MKILWIARTCPYPANDGEKLRVLNLLKMLSVQHELTVIFRVKDQEELTGVAELQKFCKEVYGVVVPKPRGTIDKIRWLMPFLFSRYPISLCTVFFRAISDMLIQISATRHFDVVQVEHSSLAIYLDHVRFEGNPVKVLTMHNIEYIRNARILKNSSFGVNKLYHFATQAYFQRWEIDVLNQFDDVIAMSNFDKSVLLEKNPKLSVHVVPNGVDVRGIPFQPVETVTETVIFVASMDSDANHDAAMYFIRDIWPLLRRLRPDLKVIFVGRYPQQELVAEHNGADITVTGKVNDVFSYYRIATVAIVPLRSGGGTRLKILEAMATGTAVVSTSVGCEGLDVEDGVNILVADTAENFAAAIEKTLVDDVFRRSLVTEARHLVEAKYDWDIIAKQHDIVYRQPIKHGCN